MKKSKYNLRFSTILASALALTACFDSSETKMVQNGSLGYCKDTTVGDMAEAFLGNPSWESGESDDGQAYVNLFGDITYNDKETRAAIQFLVEVEKGQFSFQAMEFGGVPQPLLIAQGLLNKMCDSAKQYTYQRDLEDSGMVEVPDIVSGCPEDPVAILQEHGLDAERIDIRGPDDPDSVAIGCPYRQSVDAGRVVREGTTISYRAWHEGS